MGDFIEDSNLKKKKMKQEKGKEIKVLTRPCKTEISSSNNNSVLHSDKDKGFRRSVITPIMPESEFCSRSTRQHNNKCKEEISYHDVLNLSEKPEIELNNNKMINEIELNNNKMIENKHSQVSSYSQHMCEDKTKIGTQPVSMSDGVGCSVAANYSSLEDMLSRYAYKGGTEVKRRRNDVKKTQEMQNCHPYSREAVLGEKWEDKEKKVLDYISLVKKKAQTIDCNEAQEDKSNVYEAKSSYFTLENLKCNARKENGTEAEKVLQKKKRKVEKLHKKTCAEVQVVSPYFKNSVGEVDRKERNVRIIRTPKPCGQKSLVEAKISPYFQNAKKDEGNVVSCLFEGGTESLLQMKKTKLVKTAKTKLQLSAAQKLDEAYQRRSPENSWKPPRSHFNLIQEEVHEDKSNVYEAKSSRFTRENLKCNARKENGTEAEKVLQKRKRKVEKLNKKTCAEVHVVSPYFKNSVGEVDRKERKFRIIRTPRPCGQKKSSVEAKISPYFQNVKKDEGNVVSCLVEGGTESSLQMKKTKQVKTAKTKLQLSAAQKLNEAYQRRSPENSWKPPRSHFNLIQEDHAHDPWRVLVICMLLNRTSGGQVKRIILDLFQLCSNAKVATEVAAEQIEKVIQSLGLQKKRAVMIQRLSSEYLKEDWTYVTQLHGVGKYAADGYAIFCTGKWDRVTPDDIMLHRYWDFLHSNNVTSQ